MPAQPAPESSFLWRKPPAPPAPGSFVPPGHAWWDQLQAALPNLSNAGRQELTRTSREILSLLPSPHAWADRPSPYKGVVVGSVQSGKTTSMMGVAATAFDSGFNIVIILSGLKDDLRQQTAKRFNTSLMRQSDPMDSGSRTTLGVPPGPGPLGGFALPYDLDTTKFTLLQHRMDQALQTGQPCLVVVKKESHSLSRLIGATRALVARRQAGSTPILVLDDECDEATVSSGAPGTHVIPEQIANLLALGGEVTKVAYIGYTATAAANLLQDQAAPLFPNHFVYMLRHPAREDGPIEYREPNPNNWYTGSTVFYEEFGQEPGEDENFLVSAVVHQDHLTLPPESNPSLIDALRAYFVSGAMRLVLQPEASFEDAAHPPNPHSMLIHTSPQIADHVRVAEGLQRLFGGQGAGLNKDWTFDPIKLDAWFAADETPWHAWYLRFEKTRDRLYTTWMRGGVNAPVSWAQARAKLSTVFRNARLRIVNSDEEVGSTLDFSRGMDGTGKPLLPRDVYTIVLGGSRLSRGITIDGLCVSYFARWAPVPKEDTILQMSRWFGYRGKHLEFCRLFVSPPAFRYLDSMHEHDRELRLALVEMMEKRLAPADATLLLRANPHSLPTSKLGAATKVDIKFAGKGQVFRGVECGPLALKNQEVAVAFVREVRSRAPSEIRRLDGTPPRGWISEKWTLLEVADWLDRLQYTGHNPDPSQRPIRNHYRPVDPSRPCALRFENPSTDPYEMAAYLRAWDADDALPKPTINAGFATGRMDHDTAPFNFPLADRTIMEDDMLVGSWEGRGNGWEGDARFDGITSAMLKKGTASRLQGAPGLLLLYIIHKNATGRGDFGKTRPAHTPTFGISLPAGGPTLRWIVPG